MHPPTRPAMVPLDHVLANGNIPKRKSPTSLQEQVTYLYERQKIMDLLNEYAYQLDFSMVDNTIAETVWEQLFIENCEVTYPFGTYHGRQGLGKWALSAEVRFKIMQHLSSNFTIVVESGDKAAARSTLIAVCRADPSNICKTFSEGGYYYWNLRKCGGEWKIERLFLDILWERGDSLGLNNKVLVGRA